MGAGMSGGLGAGSGSEWAEGRRRRWTLPPERRRRSAHTAARCDLRKISAPSPLDRARPSARRRRLPWRRCPRSSASWHPCATRHRPCPHARLRHRRRAAARWAAARLAWGSTASACVRAAAVARLEPIARHRSEAALRDGPAARCPPPPHRPPSHRPHLPPPRFQRPLPRLRRQRPARRQRTKARLCGQVAGGRWGRGHTRVGMRRWRRVCSCTRRTPPQRLLLSRKTSTRCRKRPVAGAPLPRGGRLR